MKVFYIAGYDTSFPSRDARSIHIMRMCEAISNLGHDVFLIVSNLSKYEEEVFDYYGIVNSFNIQIIRVPDFNGKTLLYSVKSAFYAKKFKPDIVISRYILPSLVSANLGLPVVYDSHGPAWERHKIEVIAFRFLLKNKNLVRMTTNSSALKTMYEESGKVPSCGITLAYNGSLMLPHDEFPTSWPGRQNVLQLGYMGHLYPGRGVEIIIECAKILPQHDFHIIGGTEEDIEYWKNIANYDNLFFHGFIKHSDIYRYRNKCDVLLAPYMDKNVAMAGGGGDQSKYMNPIKIVEYMSSKKPIICSDLPVLRELLDENSAVFASPNNIKEWCLAINRMKDDHFRNSLASCAFRKFENKLTWEARARILLNGFN